LYKDFLQNGWLKVEPFVQRWKSKIQEDFEKGQFVAIPAMVDLIEHTDENASEDVVQKRLAILMQLADQGSSEAQTALSFCYEWNKLNSLNSILLKLSLEERLDGLKHLAKLGSPRAQYTLGSAYYHNQILADACAFTKQERENGLLWLLEIEPCPNAYVTRIFWNPEDLDFSYTLEQRIEKLFDRAKRKDIQAFDFLWILYQQNQLGKCAIELSNEQRLKQMCALKDTNPLLFNNRAVDCFKYNTFGNISLNMGVKQRLLWLETQALKEKNHRAASVLTSIYKSNRFPAEEPLDLSFEERCQKLHELALSGYSDAAVVLTRYYQGQSPSDLKDAKDNTLGLSLSKLGELTYVGRHFSIIQGYCDKSVRQQVIALYQMLESLE